MPLSIRGGFQCGEKRILNLLPVPVPVSMYIMLPDLTESILYLKSPDGLTFRRRLKVMDGILISIICCIVSLLVTILLFLPVLPFSVILADFLAILLTLLILYIQLKVGLLNFLRKNAHLLIMTIVLGCLVCYLAVALVKIPLLAVLWLISR